MAGVLGLASKDWLNLTLKQLTIQYDAKLLHDWDLQSTQSSIMYNIGVIVMSFGGKSRAKPKTALDLHPYRKSIKRGLSITHENFDILKLVLGGVKRGK